LPAVSNEDEADMTEGTDENAGGAAEGLSAADLAIAAKESLAALTGHPAESVSALEWDGERWVVTIDIRELERVPNTTDVMATYVVQLDEQGKLLGYRRERRYVRGQADGA
jgi:hypothetical protein